MPRNAPRRLVRHSATAGVLTAAVAGTAVLGLSRTGAATDHPAAAPVAAPTVAAAAGNDLERMPGTQGRRPVVRASAVAAAPAAKPVSKPVAKSLAKPVTKSLAKPVAKSVAKPVTRTAAKPVAKPAAKRNAAPSRASRATVRTAMSPKAAALVMLAQRGWGGTSQFRCLDALWTKESGWNPHASNGSSGAYGIPQSLPGSKMRTAGADWRTNPVTQISWGLGYIRSAYGSPCSAWAHSQAHNWY